jgi:ribonuclease HII
MGKEKKSKDTPNFKVEKRVAEQGFSAIVGIDEAGRGSLCGPVCAGAVHFFDYNVIPEGLNDSKLLTPEKREALFDVISSMARVSVAFCSVEEIDRINILNATKKAMIQALTKLNPDFLLIDGNQGLKVNILQDCIVDGDKYCASIAAASIIAKVTRDRHMIELDKKYPGYNFAQHKGYGTKIHREAIQRLGPCDIHRLTFKGVKEYVRNRGV